MARANGNALLRLVVFILFLPCRPLKITRAEAGSAASRDRQRVCVSVMPDARHLPRDFDVWLVRLDRELIILDLARDDCLCELSDHCQLITEIPIQCLEVFRQPYARVTLRIGGDIAVVNVHHVGRFYERVIEVFVCGVERVIYLECACSLRQRSGNVDCVSGSAGSEVSPGRSGRFTTQREDQSRRKAFGFGCLIICFLSASDYQTDDCTRFSSPSDHQNTMR